MLNGKEFGLAGAYEKIVAKVHFAVDPNNPHNKIIVDLDKARRLYAWIVDNTFRNPKTRGCGTGDIASMLKSGSLSGKCADLNALFVGLARAAGLPAQSASNTRTTVARTLIERDRGIERIVEILGTNIDPLGDQTQLGRSQAARMAASRGKTAEEP